LIFLVFFLPLAFYLLVLGRINRRRAPVMVSGTWDFIGILFAASGFLLFGGPAIMSSLYERWRFFWLFGQGGRNAASSLGPWPFWVFLSLLYFVAVVAGAAYQFVRQRQLTCLYNTDLATVERALAAACDRLGLAPVRSGHLYVFGLLQELHSGRRLGVPEGIQAPHILPLPTRPSAPNPGGMGAEEDEFLGQSAILELEPFAALRHVTLRWSPPSSPLRQEIERELAQRLAEMGSPENDVGHWLTLVGLLLLLASLLGGALLMLRWYVQG
jgi:hypothetical protein